MRQKEHDVMMFEGYQMDVSENCLTPKSSILIGFSIIYTIHFGDTIIFGNTQMAEHSVIPLISLFACGWFQKEGK